MSIEEKKIIAVETFSFLLFAAVFAVAVIVLAIL